MKKLALLAFFLGLFAAAQATQGGQVCYTKYNVITNTPSSVLCMPDTRPKTAPAGAAYRETQTASALRGPSSLTPVTIANLIDGQTFTAYLDFNEKRFRLAGIAVPPKGKPMAREALAYLGQAAPAHSAVQLELTGKRDSDGAQLVYLWLNGELINLAFVERGLAQPADLGNQDYADVLAVGLKYAQAQKAGIWQASP